MSETKKLVRKKKEKLQEKREQYKAKFESVRRWRSGVIGDSSGSSVTEMGHLNCLIKFCEDIGMNPDEVVSARIQDLASLDPLIRNRFEDKVIEHKRKLKQEHGYSVARNSTTSLKSFFFHNHVSLAIKSPKVKDPDTYTPKTEAIETLYRAANLGWERSRVSFIYQSGARRGSIPFVTYGHIKKDFEAGVIPVHVHLKAEEVKGRYFSYDTFIGRQTVEDLRLSLELRKRGTRKIPPEVISDESPLFRKENTAVVEPCDETALTSWFVSLSRRAGFSEDETITPQALRRATNTALEDSKMIFPNWIDHILGHRPRSAQGKHYSKPSLEQLREAYTKGEPFLTLRLVPPTVDAALKPTNEAQNGVKNILTNKIERVETKPLNRLNDQEITELLDKRQQVQQSLSAYLNSPSAETLSDKIDKALPVEGCKKIRFSWTWTSKA